jgi:hypothetical protein
MSPPRSHQQHVPQNYRTITTSNSSIAAILTPGVAHCIIRSASVCAGFSLAGKGVLGRKSRSRRAALVPAKVTSIPSPPVFGRATLSTPEIDRPAALNHFRALRERLAAVGRKPREGSCWPGPRGSAAAATRPFGCDHAPALNSVDVCPSMAGGRPQGTPSRSAESRHGLFCAAKVNSPVSMAQSDGNLPDRTSVDFLRAGGQINTTSEGQGPSRR